jgi:hypothetical protein
MSPTSAECLEHRYCEWYVAQANDEGDRKFVERKAMDRTMIAIKKELEVRAAVRALLVGDAKIPN